MTIPIPPSLRRPFAIVVSVLVVIEIIYITVSISRTSDDPVSVEGSVRGPMLLALRLPPGAGPLEQISVTSSGEATRGLLTKTLPGHYVIRQVDPDMLYALDQLRHTWCDEKFPYTVSAGDTQVYEVAVRCGAGAVSGKIPRDQLPATLQRLLQSVPFP